MSNLVVAAGIFLDAVGALAVVVPDLDDSWRRRIVARTPGLRRWYRRREAFPDHNAKEEYPEDVVAALHAIAPAVRESTLDLDPATFDDVASYRPEGSHHVLFYDEDGGSVADCDVTALDDAVRDFVDRRYRLWGFALLAVGFLIQGVGTLL